MKQARGILLAAALLAIVGCSSGSRSSSGAATAAPATTGQTGTAGTPTTGTPTGSGGSGGLTGEFQRTYQGRDYWLYVPDGYTASQPTSLAVCFHGAGDSGANFYNTMKGSGWTTAARAQGVILVVPDSKSPFSDFANWSGNPNQDFAAMQSELDDVLGLVNADVGGSYNVDTASIHALGFSNGGLFLAVAGIPHSGLATNSIFGYGWGGAYPVTPADERPVHMACGTQDRFYSGAEQSQAFLAGRGHDVLWEPVSGVGHSFSGISARIGPDSALAWMTARPVGTSASPPPTPTPSAQGSGGAGGGVGTTTRTVQVPAQGGLPAFQVSYDVKVGQSYDPATPAPLVIAANMGLTGWSQLADSETLIVVDFRDHDRNGGFNFGYDVASINAVISDVQGAWNVNLKRRYYHGFSAGAHWGYAVILASANNFAGLGISAGSLQIAAQQGIWPGQVARKIAVAIRHGDQDPVVPASEGRLARDQLQQAGHPVSHSEFQGGHTTPNQADAQAIWNFLKGHALP